MCEYWLHVKKADCTVVINSEKIANLTIAHNHNDSVVVAFEHGDDYFTFTKDEWETRELKREFPPSYNLARAKDAVDGGKKEVVFSKMTRGEFVKWLGNCKSLNDSCAEGARIPYGAYEYVNRVFEQINSLATVKADKDGNVILTAKEWGYVKDALAAQQNGCNPCGETIAKVADLLARVY